MVDILILDDDMPIRSLLVDVLGDAGYRVAHASNGAEGLAIMPACNPRLILADVHMPEMDGISFARQLRSRADLAQPPIIFMTASHAVPARERGASIYLSKPFDLDGLLVHMRALLPSPDPARRTRFTGALSGV